MEDIEDIKSDFDEGDDLMAYMNFDFNGFFNVQDSKKNIWGFKCVFLPPVKMIRPKVYN